MTVALGLHFQDLAVQRGPLVALHQEPVPRGEGLVYHEQRVGHVRDLVLGRERFQDLEQVVLPGRV